MVNQGVLSLDKKVLKVGLHLVKRFHILDGVGVGHNIIPISIVERKSESRPSEQVLVLLHAAFGGDLVLELSDGTGTVPLHIGVLGVELLFVEIEIVEDAVEVGARGSIELVLLRPFIWILNLRAFSDVLSENAGLTFKSEPVAPVGGERIIVVAIAVDICFNFISYCTGSARQRSPRTS